MTFQGGNFGEEAHDEAKQPPHGPQARPFGPDFTPPAYAGQPPAAPGPNTPHYPPQSGPVPPWDPPPPEYPPSGYGPPRYPDPPPYGVPSYPSSPPQFGPSYPPPGYSGGGYGGPPVYPGPYDPYHPYLSRPHQTNGLAVGSLISSIAGIPLFFACYLGIPISIVGVVLGVVALNQIKHTNQQGRGLAIAGIAVGAIAPVLLVIFVLVVLAASHSLFITPSIT
jgi:Domain of unknown function (DUF4190)